MNEKEVTHANGSEYRVHSGRVHKGIEVYPQKRVNSRRKYTRRTRAVTFGEGNTQRKRDWNSNQGGWCPTRNPLGSTQKRDI